MVKGPGAGSKSFGHDLSVIIHKNLIKMLRHRRGDVISRAELLTLYKAHFPGEDASWMQATDHCINKTNKGACPCAKSDQAIFEWLSRGKYKIKPNKHNHIQI